MFSKVLLFSTAILFFTAASFADQEAPDTSANESLSESVSEDTNDSVIIPQVVTAVDGIPVYKSKLAEESEICGWLSEDAEVVTLNDGSSFLKLMDHPLLGNCSGDLYVQDGFLRIQGFQTAIPGGKPRRTQKWKSENPSFSVPCKERSEGGKIIVSFVGDILLHGALQNQAYKRDSHFKSLWTKITPIFQKADLSYANLEGPIGEGVNCRGKQTSYNKMSLGAECRKSSSSVYTSYPRFNYHPQLSKDLKESGIDVVSTANNHSLDRYSTGANRTLESLKQNSLAYMGTRTGDSDSPYYTITNTNVKGTNFKIAWIACTFSTNGVSDKKNQVLFCYKKGKSNPALLETVTALSNTADGVIVTPHWGPTEYVHSVHTSQLSLGKDLMEAGAAAVIGAHPHVLQPWEKYTTKDGRDGIIHYSLGNFVSNQKQTARRASMVLLVGFQKTAKGLAVDGVRYVPMYFDSWNTGTRELLPLDTDKKMYTYGKGSLKNILSLFPEELRLNSTDALTTCK